MCKLWCFTLQWCEDDKTCLLAHIIRIFAPLVVTILPMTLPEKVENVLINNYRLLTDFKSKSFFSQALDAVKANDSAHLQDCVPSLEVEDGLPLLKLAAERDHSGCLRMLLSEKKFDPNSSKSNGATPLHVASMHGQMK